MAAPAAPTIGFFGGQQQPAGAFGGAPTVFGPPQPAQQAQQAGGIIFGAQQAQVHQMGKKEEATKALAAFSIFLI